MASTRKVALLGLGDIGYDSGLLRGILAFAQDQADWFFPYNLNETEGIEALPHVEVDGIIAHVTSKELCDLLVKRGLPVINLARVLNEVPFPTVSGDDAAAGQLGADFFLARGYESLAFYGANPNPLFVRLREQGMRQGAKKKGVAYSAFPFDLELAAEQIRDVVGFRQKLAEWISELPKPVGVLSVNDRRGWHLAELCRELEISVPEHVAIVGVDNYERMCLMSRPSLSSVEWPVERIGREAASWLNLLMEGRKLPGKQLRLPPTGVFSRGSTDAVAVSDAPLSDALRYMREHAREGIRVADVIKAVPISRRDLERRCFASLGRTPLQELHRIRVEHAQRLMAGSDLPLPQVAVAAGFRDVNHLSRVFNRHTGKTPAVWRRAQKRVAAEASKG